MSLSLEQFCDAVGASKGLARPWHPHILLAMERWDISTPLRQAGFLSQMSVECNNFRTFTENLNYSVQGLADTWPTRYSTNSKEKGVRKIPNDLAKAIGRIDGVRKCDERRLANLTYGNRFGNVEGTDDGWNYRGRGPKQITFKDNYRDCGEALGLALLTSPDLLLMPEHGAQSAGWYWHSHGCNEFMDNDDVIRTTEAINGGRNGLDARIAGLARAKKVLGI